MKQFENHSQVDGVQLIDGKVLTDNVWESADNKYRFTLMGGNLVIGRGAQAGATMNGSITVLGNDRLRSDDKPRCKSSTRKRRSCFEKHSGLSNEYGSYRSIYCIGKSISPGRIPSLSSSLSRATGIEALQ